MGKDDWLWLALLFIIGGALSKKKVDYFRCWNCKRVILPNTLSCPACGVSIDWGGQHGA